MKFLAKLILFSLVGTLFISCDLLFTQEKKYTKYTDMDSLNHEISETAYFWSMVEASEYNAYYTGKNALLYAISVVLLTSASCPPEISNLL